ncbi:MAG: hypothetical protein M3R24_18070, partial [Chloroflexota bacterium]|nr:hypothetical protein [Chloroflexota bacterium]
WHHTDDTCHSSVPPDWKVVSTEEHTRAGTYHFLERIFCTVVNIWHGDITHNDVWLVFIEE